VREIVTYTTTRSSPTTITYGQIYKCSIRHDKKNVSGFSSRLYLLISKSITHTYDPTSHFHQFFTFFFSNFFFFIKFHLKIKGKKIGMGLREFWKGKGRGGQLWRALCGCDNNREAHLCVCVCVNWMEERLFFRFFILLPCFTTRRHTTVQLASHKKQLGDSLKKNNGTNMATAF
jgi:hypothetical protein